MKRTTASISGHYWRHLFAVMLISLTTLSAITARAADDQGNGDGVSASDVKDKDIPVDQRIFMEDWNDVPFDTKYFTYTDQQMKDKWDYLMRGLRAPYPSTDLIVYAIKHYPDLFKDMDPALLKNPEALHKKTMDVWRLFFAGKFQQAYRDGQKIGVLGKMPAAFSEVMYAMYLTPRKSVKDMVLQDVVNTVGQFTDDIDKMKKSNRKDIRELAAFAILGRAYATARIAEEAPVPVAVARGYIRKIKTDAEEVLKLVPNHPLGNAFLAGVNAGIMRKVGKFTGRLTYGARTTTVQDAFDKALELSPDIAILQYEYANALIYMNRKRELNLAMRHLEKATRLRPSFAMEALDSMYAYKRLQEVRMYALNYRSFREFDKDRFHYMRVTDHNLTSVLTPPLTMDKLKHPEKYKLPERK